MKKEDFKPHVMYNPKTGEGTKASTYKQHLKLKEMGYVHSKPAKKTAKKKTAKKAAKKKSRTSYQDAVNKRMSDY